jgi:uncharacterized membrane protein YkoI
LKVKLGLLAVIFFGLFFMLYQVLVKDASVIVSQQEAAAIASKLYDGEILESKMNKKKNQYVITVENDKGIYRLSVDGQTKKVSDVELIHKKNALLTAEEAKERISSEFNGNVTTIKTSGEKQPLFAEALVEKEQKEFRVVYDLKKRKIVSAVELKTKETASQPVSPKKNNNQQKNVTSEQRAKEIALSQLNGKVSNVVKMDSRNGTLYKVTVENEVEGAHVYVQESTGEISSLSWFSKMKKTIQESEDTDELENDDDTDGDIGSDNQDEDED